MAYLKNWMLCRTYVRARDDYGETRQSIKVAEWRGGGSLEKDESIGNGDRTW